MQFHVFLAPVPHIGDRRTDIYASVLQTLLVHVKLGIVCRLLHANGGALCHITSGEYSHVLFLHASGMYAISAFTDAYICPETWQSFVQIASCCHSPVPDHS